MIDRIIKHAAKAAAAHGIASRVWHGPEYIEDRRTGRFFVRVQFYQEVCTRPENKTHLVSDIECRRIIGISATDARRLFKSRVGLPGGQAYVIVRGAHESIYHVADTPDEAEREVMNLILSGLARIKAHDVADRAARIEVEMREKLRSDMAALA